MESLFVSYTYKPHPEFEEATFELVARVRAVAEALGLRVVTGEDLGGETLSDAIKQRIQGADALVAVETPWRKLENGDFIASDWVRREFTYAVDQQSKPAIAVVHDKVVPNTAFADRERIRFDPADTAEALLKLIRTLNGWKRQFGRSFEVELGPATISDRLNDEDASHRCEYRVMSEHEPTPWREAKFWHDVGGAFAYLRGVADDGKIQVRVRLGAERWRSRFTGLVSRVTLEKEAE